MPRWTPQQVTPKINALLAAGKLSYRPASRSWYYDAQPLSEREISRRIAYVTGAPVCHVELAIAVRGQELAASSQTSLQQWVRDLEADTPKPSDPDADRWPGNVALRQFVRAMMREDTPQELFRCHLWALKQWIWQTKRNILGMPVTWHVTPIFWSKENGTGKSTNLNRLLAPVDAFTRHMAVDELGEKFSKKLLSQTHVVVFDEFARAGDADIATFKAMITGRPLEGREMYSEGGFYAENRLSCIATSNLAPPHDFEDSSGARRFWSIHCHGGAAAEGGSVDRMRVLDSLDWGAIWRCISVDVHSVHQLIPRALRDRMEWERNRKMRASTSFEVFVAECLERSQMEERVAMKNVIEAYRNWCAHTGHRRLKGGQEKTAERLVDLGYTCINNSNRRFLCGHRIVGDT